MLSMETTGSKKLQADGSSSGLPMVEFEMDVGFGVWGFSGALDGDANLQTHTTFHHMTTLCTSHKARITRRAQIRFTVIAA